jgi:hypothetical protein
MNLTWKKLISKSWFVVLVAVAALAWIGEDGGNSAHSEAMSKTAAPATTDGSCNPHDPLSPCASASRYAVPIGSGLAITLIEDLL